MLVSSELQVANARVLREIGRVTASSGCFGAGGDAGQQERALKRLIEAAKEVDADAIIGLDYSVDGVSGSDLTVIPLQRVAVTGIAVKLARAA